MKERFYEILDQSVILLRKGSIKEEKTVGGVHVVDVYAMSHRENLRKPEDWDIYDFVLLEAAVNKEQAEKIKTEFENLLKDYPYPERLIEGPSYIEVGASLGSQDHAFKMFGLGKFYKLWDVITPIKFGLKDPAAARNAAGQGFIMMTGYATT